MEDCARYRLIQNDFSRYWKLAKCNPFFFSFLFQIKNTVRILWCFYWKKNEIFPLVIFTSNSHKWSKLLKVVVCLYDISLSYFFNLNHNFIRVSCYIIFSWSRHTSHARYIDVIQIDDSLTDTNFTEYIACNKSLFYKIEILHESLYEISQASILKFKYSRTLTTPTLIVLTHISAHMSLRKVHVTLMVLGNFDKD